MRIGFAGTPNVAANVLSSLIEKNWNIVLVITKPDIAQGRGKRIMQSPVSQVAEAHGIELIKPSDLNDSDLAQSLIDKNLDLIIVIAYGKLIPVSLLTVTKYGWFNLHFSLLPKYRGAAPVQHALKNGETESGITLFKIDAGMDTGPIWHQKKYQIKPEDDALSMLNSLAELGSELINESLSELVSGNLTLIPQQEINVSYAGKIDASLARINWNESANSISNLIRACAAGPIAFTEFNSNRFAIHEVEILNENNLRPGEIARINKSIRVGSGTMDLELKRVQPSGKNILKATEWFNGVREENPQFT